MISQSTLNAALVDLFDLSPIPFSLSTIDHDARYIKVNPAYLHLTGRTWGEIDGQSLGVDLPYSIDDPARLRRLHLLDTVGFYEQAELDMLHVSGRVVPTLVTARRLWIDGECLDIEMIMDNSARKAAESAIVSAAHVDFVTGLQNRKSFELHLASAMTELSPDTRLVLAFVDLNRFKRVNDLHGHAVGDSLLKVVGQRIAEWSDGCDFVARLGGDEFAIVSRLSGRGEFLIGRYFDLAKRIARLIVVNDKFMQVGCAIGVAEAKPGMSTAALVCCADKLMYAAKSSGTTINVQSDVSPFRDGRAAIA